MPMIVVHESGQPTRLFEVRSASVRIGRGADCELLLPNISVSRSHALLDSFEGTTALLTPQSKKNPTRHRDTDLGAPITLEHGEDIRIGKFRLTWLHEAALDAYRLHELAEMPRFVRMRKQVHEETFAMSPDLRRKLDAYEELRNRAGLVDPSGQAYRLGAGPVEIGPTAQIPCASRLGRWTAARLSWVGNGHKLERVGLFSTVTVAGATVSDQCMLETDQELTVNGSSFQYRLLRLGR
jgi:hypothetical protein